MDKIFIEFFKSLLSQNLLNEKGVKKIDSILSSGIEFSSYIESSRITSFDESTVGLKDILDTVKENAVNLPQNLVSPAVEFNNALDGLALELRKYMKTRSPDLDFSMEAYREFIGQIIIKKRLKEETAFYRKVLEETDGQKLISAFHEDGKTGNTVKLTYFPDNHTKDVKTLVFVISRRPFNRTTSLIGPFGLSFEIRDSEDKETENISRKDAVRTLIAAEGLIQEEYEWARETSKVIVKRHEAVSKDKKVIMKATGVNHSVLQNYSKYLHSLLACIEYYRDNKL